ncbi:hypothetical protein [Bartonella tamiae]|uniref:Uncharacterized protein n=1 Tax=Bartonella tamiae Th239 TaxID=1094558 RepID=J0R1K6_9HYPH|nr:hypothetical protein [Bartonella tamiae]EJF89404.1 hypothetical protein ME5_01955 [Bartonella tamiae Th239]EJF92731.1 hypothetical protein MEG_01901 [Bartonella tamiae Th307]
MKISFLFKSIGIIGFIILLYPFNAIANENRFHFEKRNNSFIRFDGKTGAIDMCSEEKGTIQCIVSDDQRSLYEREIEDLKQKISDLKKNNENTSHRLPNREELDQAYDTMKYFFNRFQNDLSGENFKK